MLSLPSLLLLRSQWSLLVCVVGPFVIQANTQSVVNVHMRNLEARSVDIDGFQGVVHLDNITVLDEHRGIRVVMEIGDVDIEPNHNSHANAML